MTTPVNALSASALRAPLPTATQPVQVSGVARQTAALRPAEQKPEATSQQKIEALVDINDSLINASVDLRFEFDKDSRQSITKVIDTQTGEMIRQMPSEDAVHASKVLGRLQGILFSHKA